MPPPQFHTHQPPFSSWEEGTTWTTIDAMTARGANTPWKGRRIGETAARKLLAPHHRHESTGFTTCQPQPHALQMNPHMGGICFPAKRANDARNSDISTKNCFAEEWQYATNRGSRHALPSNSHDDGVEFRRREERGPHQWILTDPQPFPQCGRVAPRPETGRQCGKFVTKPRR